MLCSLLRLSRCKMSSIHTTHHSCSLAAVLAPPLPTTPTPLPHPHTLDNILQKNHASILSSTILFAHTSHQLQHPLLLTHQHNLSRTYNNLKMSPHLVKFMTRIPCLAPVPSIPLITRKSESINITSQIAPSEGRRYVTNVSFTTNHLKEINYRVALLIACRAVIWPLA